MSNLNVPSFQWVFVAVFEIFNEAARALALVSIFVVLVVELKGPRDEPLED